MPALALLALLPPPEPDPTAGVAVRLLREVPAGGPLEIRDATVPGPSPDRPRSPLAVRPDLFGGVVKQVYVGGYGGPSVSDLEGVKFGLRPSTLRSLPAGPGGRLFGGLSDGHLKSAPGMAGW